MEINDLEIIQPNSYILQMRKTRVRDGEERIQISTGPRQSQDFELIINCSTQVTILPGRLNVRLSQPLHLGYHFLPHLKEAGRKRQKWGQEGSFLVLKRMTMCGSWSLRYPDKFPFYIPFCRKLRTVVPLFWLLHISNGSAVRHPDLISVHFCPSCLL